MVIISSDAELLLSTKPFLRHVSFGRPSRSENVCKRICSPPFHLLNRSLMRSEEIYSPEHPLSCDANLLSNVLPFSSNDFTATFSTKRVVLGVREHSFDACGNDQRFEKYT